MRKLNLTKPTLHETRDSKQAKFQGDRTTAGAITVRNIKKTHISMVNHLDLGGYRLDN